MVDTRPPTPIVFELDRLGEYTDTSMLDELRRVASIIPNGSLTTREFQRHSRVSFDTVTRRFGSWEQALKAAGLSERWLGSRAAKLAATKSMTDENILEALTGLARRLEKTQLTWRDVAAHLPFRGEVLKKRWGSMRGALEAAGLSSARSGLRRTDEECFDNLLAVWTHYGRPPRFREMGKLPSRIGTTPYTRRFGTWNKALAAFVERVNADAEVSVVTVEEASDIGPRSPVVTSEARDRREISIGLRFRVLHRDRFKCVLCGNAPSSDPKCVLHVDHITPWSKGGRTVIENLRSLCNSCNIGRSNRYAD